MPSDTLTVIREPSDIDWLEEEAWRRASQWTLTPELVFALKAMLEREDKDNPSNGKHD